MSNDRTIEPRGWMRNLARWLVSGYYPTIKISGADRIPQSGPLLLCANHPNSLLDPVLIGIAARRPVRFMAKAPLFDHPILGPPMRALGMVPTFRGEDDSRQVRRNFQSLDVGAKVLVDGHAMGIFPEGVSSDKAHLETVRSGAARMAVQAAEEGAEGLKVVPIGINYEHKDRFRTAVWLQVGEPIDVDRCLAEQEGDNRKARRALTRQLESGLKEIVIHLEEPEWEPWLDDLLTLTRDPQKSSKDAMEPLERRKRIADAINYFLAHDRERTESVAARIKAYRNAVGSAGLRVDSPVLRVRGLRVWARLLGSGLCLALLFIPAVLGTLYHLVPFLVVRWIAARMDQPGRKTVSTNRLLVGVLLYAVWYGVTAGGIIVRYGSWWAAAAVLIAAPFFGVLAIHYWRRAGRTARLLWQQLLVTVRRGALKRLREEESELRAGIQELARQYAGLSPDGEQG